MEIVLAIVALTLAFLTVAVIVTVRGVRAARRGIERGVRQARRAVTDATLRARATQPGPLGEAARARKELRESLESTRTVLAAVSRNDPALGEAQSLLERLHEHAQQVDGELAMLMDVEPDRSRLAARLPGLRERADRIKASADSLRHAAQDRVLHHDAEQLDALQRQIEIESGALRHWTTPEQDGGQALPPQPPRRELFRKAPRNETP
ncbi:hypothetical protein [Streptomyces aidingensis]|uniref:Secreted protein n=1 Tax=Streptomyces aidingensis TaxID=910347 RepID=A0A1I1FKE0_9ACTN|nr:hypothetical protein [Streptomyces aidingensis]SFB99887.1 hypothetical protein SAMN05421773_101778 [Streptomyces aidingensis]